LIEQVVEGRRLFSIFKFTVLISSTKSTGLSNSVFLAQDRGNFSISIFLPQTITFNYLFSHQGSLKISTGKTPKYTG